MQGNILPSSLIENIKIRDLRDFAACNFFLVIPGCLAMVYAPTPHSVTISNDYPSSPRASVVNISSRAPIKTRQAVAGLYRVLGLLRGNVHLGPLCTVYTWTWTLHSTTYEFEDRLLCV